METNKRPEPGEIYKHFKNKLYQIITIATHSETGEKLVVYQALYGDFRSYVRPLSMFTSVVDKNKYPFATQKYRFELIERSSLVKEVENHVSYINEKETTEGIGNIQMVNKEHDSENREINSNLLKFLDATSYEEKLEIFLSMNKSIDERTLSAICISLDLVVNEGSLKEQYESVRNCLETYVKFESKRLR